MREQLRFSFRTGSTEAGATADDAGRASGPARETGPAESATAAPSGTDHQGARIEKLRTRGRRARRVAAAGGGLIIVATLLAAATWSSPAPPGEAEVVVPSGAAFAEIVDTLESAQVVRRPLLFRAMARIRGLDRMIKAGTYRIERGVPTGRVLDILAQGNVVTQAVTFPEGLDLRGIASRIATAAGLDSAGVADTLLAAGRWSAPGAAEAGGNATAAPRPAPETPGIAGPALEGYLFPDTYRFAEGVSTATVVHAMLDRYQRYWSPERRARLAELDLSEREIVTLASIIQAEARMIEEMPTIASVYHNRLRINMPLQADPTVLYALGGHRPRLLYAAMDSVADHPYNTYTHPGLPPGPINAPGTHALDAALWPQDTDYLYFVARPNGSHVFSRSLREHNNARIRTRREASSP